MNIYIYIIYIIHIYIYHIYIYNSFKSEHLNISFNCKDTKNIFYAIRMISSKIKINFLISFKLHKI